MRRNYLDNQFIAWSTVEKNLQNRNKHKSNIDQNLETAVVQCLPTKSAMKRLGVYTYIIEKDHRRPEYIAMVGAEARSILAHDYQLESDDADDHTADQQLLHARTAEDGLEFLRIP